MLCLIYIIRCASTSGTTALDWSRSRCAALPRSPISASKVLSLLALMVRSPTSASKVISVLAFTGAKVQMLTLNACVCIRYCYEPRTAAAPDLSSSCSLI